MSTVTLHYLTSPVALALTRFSSTLKSLLKSIHNSITLSRQLTANRDIAQWILKEYPEHTYESLLTHLDNQAVERYQQELEKAND